MDIVMLLLAGGIGYVLGSIPVGLLIGHAVRGLDVRNYGSNRTGGTNVQRVLGTRWAVVVGLLDLGKALLATSVGAWMAGDGGAALGGWMAIFGHIYPLFAGFRGGRGVATMLGASLGLAWPAAVLMFAMAAFVIWRWRYVSLGSISGAAMGGLVGLALTLTGTEPWQTALYSVAAAALVIASHRDNIERLRNGTERRVGQRAH